MFDVHTLTSIVSYFKQLARTKLIFTAVIKFKFHTQISRTVTVEYRFRLVVIVVDYLVHVKTISAIWMVMIFFIFMITSVIIMNYRITSFTSDVIFIVTSLAQITVCRIIIPMSVTTITTNECFTS